MWSATNKSGFVSLSESGRSATKSGGSGSWGGVRSDIAVDDKRYWEVEYLVSGNPLVGACVPSWNFSTNGGPPFYSVAASTLGLSVGQKARVALDVPAGKLWIGTPTAWYGGGDPGAGTLPSFSFTPGTVLHPALNFGDPLNQSMRGDPSPLSTPDGFLQLILPAGVSGVVTDVAGLPCERIVRAYLRDTGELLAETTSDPVTGAYSIATGAIGEVQVVVLDDAAGDLYNDLIMRVLPE